MLSIHMKRILNYQITVARDIISFTGTTFFAITETLHQTTNHDWWVGLRSLVKSLSTSLLKCDASFRGNCLMLVISGFYDTKYK
jgi:hypothetical protein